MKTLLVTVALVMFAVPMSAGIVYEFTQKQSSDDGRTPVAELTARVTVDGTSSRYDFIGGNTYPPGTYAISTDGSRRIFFIDPTQKWYTEVDTTGVATSLGASQIKIENLKSNVEHFTDKARLAGVDTLHQRQTITYDITLPSRGMAVKQHVRTEIESWTTSQYPELHASVLTSDVDTGNPEVDRLIEAESSKTGFPLRQIVRMRVSSPIMIKSELKIPTIRTITRETSVTSIRQSTPTGTAFTIPATYRRADQPNLPRIDSKVLTFDEPASK